MVAIEDDEVEVVDLIREMHSEQEIRRHKLVRGEVRMENENKSAASIIKEVIDNYQEDAKLREKEEELHKNQTESSIETDLSHTEKTIEWKTWNEIENP